MSDTVKVKYAFTARARMLGEMEIPRAMFDRLPDDEMWSDEIEEYVLDGHDYLAQPPEIDVDDAELDDLSKVEG